MTLTPLELVPLFAVYAAVLCHGHRRWTRRTALDLTGYWRRHGGDEGIED